MRRFPLSREARASTEDGTAAHRSWSTCRASHDRRGTEYPAPASQHRARRQPKAEGEKGHTGHKDKAVYKEMAGFRLLIYNS